MGPPARKLPSYADMGTQNAPMQEANVTEIEERIESQRESAQLMRKAMDCECPDTSCPVAHES